MTQRLMLCALLALPALRALPAQAGGEIVVFRTFYDQGTTTASGSPVFEGEAGCGSAFPLGTVLDLDDGQEVVCLDRGLLSSYGVDVYCNHGRAACSRENPSGPMGASVVAWGGR